LNRYSRSLSGAENKSKECGRDQPVNADLAPAAGWAQSAKAASANPNLLDPLVCIYVFASVFC